MCFGIYVDRPVIYTPPSCVSGFTLTEQWYILPRHVFRDLLWQTSDIYSPVMCFGIYVDRPVIYTPQSCLSLVSQSKFRNTWRGCIYHWPVKVNPETHDWVVYITGLSTWIPKHMTGEYISLVCQSKSRNTWRGSIYHCSVNVNPPVMCFGIHVERPVIYTTQSCVSGFTLTGQWYIHPRHVFRNLLWETSDIYYPVMCFRIYFDRPVIYTPPSCFSGFTLREPVIYTPPSCVSGFTLTDQWYILPRHVFRDFLWETSDIYSPVMCFGIYFERPVIYIPPSCVSGFTLRDQWYIFPRHVFRDLRWQTSTSKSRNTWRGCIYHWSVKVNPETHDGGVYITGLSK
jgi:hypothetical protein